MNLENFISLTQLSTHYEIEVDFLHKLNEYDLVEIFSIDDEKYLESESINHFEKILRIHNDLEVNIESIDIVFNLLKKIEELQSELESAKNKLRLYEGAL
jgi:hypothetical protein